MVAWPLNPNVGDTITGPNGQVWKWDGVTWVGGGGAGGTLNIMVSATPPASPAEGDAWWDSGGGVLYIHFQGAWVAASIGGPTFSPPNPLPVLENYTSYLTANVAMPAVAWYNGPSISVGNVGTWYVNGAAVTYPAGAVHMQCRIWDGVTTLGSTWVYQSAANWGASHNVAGIITNPAGSLTLQCRPSTAAAHAIYFSDAFAATGRSTYINAVRIG